MKFFKSISLLPLITLPNLIQGMLIEYGSGKDTCLKLGSHGNLKIKECIKGSQFILENKKLCLKDDTSFCFAKKSSLMKGRTIFTRNSARHLLVTFNEDCGCLINDASNWGLGQLYFKYSAKQRRFRMTAQTPMPLPGTEYSQWKVGDECWTSNNPVDEWPKLVKLEKCRSTKINTNQEKTQLWKYENGEIKTHNGRICLSKFTGNSGIYTQPCSKATAKWTFTDSGIKSSSEQDKCLMKSLVTTTMKVGPCLEAVKLTT